MEHLENTDHINLIEDTDAFFTINKFTRAISYSRGSDLTLIQLDHNSERFTFRLPRYIEDHDMSACNKVEVHYINIGIGGTNKNKGLYDVLDLRVDPEDSEFVLCSWLISQNATRLAGTLNFLVRYACMDGKVVEYSWHTAIYKGVKVGEGIDNVGDVVEQYVDILEQWKQNLNDTGVISIENITAARDEALGAMNAATQNFSEMETKALERLDQAEQEIIDAKNSALSDMDTAEKESISKINQSATYIGDNGNWFVGGTDTGVQAKGESGITPHIGDNGNWWVGDVDTGVDAGGDFATDEEVEQLLDTVYDDSSGDIPDIDLVTPRIGANGHWWVGAVDTGVEAQGPQGKPGTAPHIGTNGNWFVGDTDTGVKAQGPQGVPGLNPHIGTNGNWWVGDTDTGERASYGMKLIAKFTQSGNFTWVCPEEGIYTFLLIGGGGAGAAVAHVTSEVGVHCYASGGDHGEAVFFDRLVPGQMEVSITVGHAGFASGLESAGGLEGGDGGQTIVTAYGATKVAQGGKGGKYYINPTNDPTMYDAGSWDLMLYYRDEYGRYVTNLKPGPNAHGVTDSTVEYAEELFGGVTFANGKFGGNAFVLRNCLDMSTDPGYYLIPLPPTDLGMGGGGVVSMIQSSLVEESTKISLGAGHGCNGAVFIYK